MDSSREYQRTPYENGRATPGARDEQPIGNLFRRLSNDASHLVRQEIELAKAELRHAADNVGKAAYKLGIAAGLALVGIGALTAFAVIGLGVLLANYWLSALIVGVAVLAIGAAMAKRAITNLQEANLRLPATTGTLRDDTQWAKEEARSFKRELTA